MCVTPVIPKCGEFVSHHWAHKSNRDCDPWWEESEWHLGWKKLIRPENTEVVMKPHRADIVGNRGMVVELQHSRLPPDQVRAREAFYRNMVWLVDGLQFRKRLRVQAYRNGYLAPYCRLFGFPMRWIQIASAHVFIEVGPTYVPGKCEGCGEQLYPSSEEFAEGNAQCVMNRCHTLNHVDFDRDPDTALSIYAHPGNGPGYLISRERFVRDYLSDVLLVTP